MTLYSVHDNQLHSTVITYSRTTPARELTLASNSSSQTGVTVRQSSAQATQKIKIQAKYFLNS